MLWLSESVLRAVKLRVKLRVGRLAGPYRDVQFARALVSMAMSTEAALKFVDELKKSPCSE